MGCDCGRSKVAPVSMEGETSIASGSAAAGGLSTCRSDSEGAEDSTSGAATSTMDMANAVCYKGKDSLVSCLITLGRVSEKSVSSGRKSLATVDSTPQPQDPVSDKSRRRLEVDLAHFDAVYN